MFVCFQGADKVLNDSNNNVDKLRLSMNIVKDPEVLPSPESKKTTTIVTPAIRGDDFKCTICNQVRLLCRKQYTCMF